MSAPAVSERSATRLLILGRDAASGRLRNPRALDVGLRAAMFVDLIRTGHLIDHQGSPRAIEDSPTGDRLLDAVRATVVRRPDVAWRRWYRHVHVDQVACVDELIALGRWSRNPGPLPRYTDTQPDAAVAAWEHTTAVLALRRDPVDGQDAAVAVLAALCGAVGGLRKGARSIQAELGPLLEALSRDPQRAQDLRTCLLSAARGTGRAVPRLVSR
jgi:Golgi phosphoprotein 3 (GPP34)